jgi:hypothetical protein
LADLQAIVALAEIALPVVESTGGASAAQVAVAEAYLNAVSTGADQTAALIPSDGTVTPAIAVQIGAVWAKVVAPNLPAGTPQEVVADLAAIAPAIGVFLQSIGVTPAPPAAAANAMAARTASVSTPKSAASGRTIKLSTAQLAQVQQVRVRAKVLESATRAR